MLQLPWLDKSHPPSTSAGHLPTIWALPWLAALAACICIACGRPPPAPKAATVQIQPAPATAAEENPPEAAAAPATPDERPKAPAGYIEMEAFRITPTPEGLAVVLTDTRDQSVVLPIFIGGTEALSIDLRIRHEHPARPLTHDLLDAMLREVGAKLVKVHVDSIQESVFFGRVFLKHGGRVVEIDARPSDAIALAVGAAVPIFVAQAVLDEAGIYREGQPPDPMKTLH